MSICRNPSRLFALVLILFPAAFPRLLGGQHRPAFLDDLRGEGGVSEKKHSRPLFSWDGFRIANRDGSSELNVYGYLQWDTRLFSNDLKGRSRDVLLFRRVRPLAEGRIANRMAFRFMPDFGEGKSVLQEVYVEWTFNSAAALQLGKFKTPIGLEVLRPDRDMIFVERSTASGLVPTRDLGAQLHGSFWDNALTYALGFFSGAEDGTNANFEWRGSKQGVARIFFEPFTSNRDKVRPLGIGIAGSLGFNHGAPPKFNTVGQETFFRYSNSSFALGQHRRWSPQANYFSGRFGVIGEYIYSGETIYSNNTSRYLSNRSWNIGGSIILTGEKNRFQGFEPAHPFAPFEGRQHWGAWELEFRHSELSIDKNAFPRYANPATSAQGAVESAAGLNWHINRHTKLVMNYEYTGLQRSAASDHHFSPERAVLTEIQLTL
jgi:phosphate-selective porin OprO/OprP